jgi:TolB-like protein
MLDPCPVANAPIIRDHSAQLGGSSNGRERLRTLSGISHAVFISYASQDAEAAGRICEALRAAGIEVWFDQSELRGGDAWDQSIRKQIKTCGLFLPVISRNTHDRDEGYFRLEWKLAVDRCHLMATDKAFLLPVVIDDTRENDERVPERFRDVQWTRMPGGAPPMTFVERVRRLLSGELPQEPTATALGAARVSAATTSGKPVFASWRSKAGLLATIAVVVVLAYLVANRLVLSKRGAEAVAVPGSTAQSAPATAFNPPPHSIAVLPFVNMSGDKDQEYFSEGLTEELLNSLSRINELQVAARTSSFSFQGEHPDIATVAHRLNVAAVLEGSVRRSTHTIRITAQLVSGITGFHVWSQTYDRDVADALKLQTEIAVAVASALKVQLLGAEATMIEVGGTHNPAAFDAYLRATKIYWDTENEENNEAAIAIYSEAISLDPDYALAYAARSLAFVFASALATTPPAVRAAIEKAYADATKAIALAPNLSEGHLALAGVYQDRLEFKRATEEYERALTLAPGNARILRTYGQIAVFMGHSGAGLTALRRAVALDPLNPVSRVMLGFGLYNLRRYAEAVEALKDAQALVPASPSFASETVGFAYYGLGNLETARSSCEKKAADDSGRFCLAIVYDKLGRHADAQTMLGKLRAADGDTAAFEYSAIYTQWGDTDRALGWLDTAMRMRSQELSQLRVEPLLDPLRKQPRFQAIERELKFPN